MTEARNSVRERRDNGSRRKRWLILALVVVLAAGGLVASRLFAPEGGAVIPTYTVEQGEFVIGLKLKGGELEATQSQNIVAPQVRGQLKIVSLFPEGEQAEVEAILVQFEATEFEKRVTDASQELESAKADLVKTQATQKAEIAKLEADIKDQEANLRLAELQVQRMEFEATVEKERVQIEARRAQLNRDQAVEKLASTRIVHGADVRKRELEISRRERELEKAQRELESLTIKAQSPGLVVYGKVWKGERPEKIRVGDEVWGGVNVISLPDLTRMQVKAAVNEVDVDKVRVGQEATIKLDALPEPTFHGKVTTVAPLGREKEGEKNVKVFDVVIAIDEQDPRLKPGMTATSDVVIETVPPRPQARPDTVQPAQTEEVVVQTVPLPVFVPLDAVHEKDGRTIVYRMENGAPRAVEVKLGKKNEDYVIIEEGLQPGDRVALRDPTLVADDIGGMSQAEQGAAAPAPQAR
ncbi:MAG: HlyD family secretion protein [Candidatus Latescibacterota bacterium]